MKLVLMHAEVTVSKFFTCKAISSGVKAINAVIVEEICNGKWTKSGNFKRLNFGSGKGRISFKCAQAIMISWLMWEENGKTDGWDLNSRCSSQIQVVVEESTEEFSFRFLHFLSKKTQRQGGTQFCRALILNFAIHYLFRFGFGFPTVLGMARLVAGKVKRKGSKASSEVTTISLREVAVLGLCN